MSVEVEPMDELLKFRQIDAYGSSRHISAVLPALSAAIGQPMPTSVHPDPEGARVALGFPKTDSAVIVLVDGLGFWNLAMRAGHAPYLRGLMNQERNAKPIATCIPSTTPIVMGAFGTGTCPGMTGMTGFTQRNEETGELAQLISFAGAPEPEDLQRQPTVFERLVDNGVRVTSVGLPKFAHSSLTRAALRGPEYQGSQHRQLRVRAAIKAAGKPGITYYYVDDVDKAGHHYGPMSEEWATALENTDEQLRMLRRGLKPGTLMVVVADHGMVEVDFGNQIDIAANENLTRDVALVAGEPRMTMLYTQPGADVDVMAVRWREELADRAEIFTRDEAIKRGLYGSVEARVRPLIGDVIVCAKGNATIVDSRTHSEGAMGLLGVHGSLTRLEREIPCLIDVA
ncbi:nucleotide pyrophosphatase/phosphodiesterase family protein [Bifidobacterium sp. ESL0745]|uniref:alkaline phosphatase family protein n=1 Tax=Bifidobacterium sp. ESL0745 TaxID=2983226 RepID=UPI0023F826BB|nr:nucleotide pyrophosphatase/phosphodiesterase family protein [Bifidobacterium sp. ESL0745]MDF7664802.1 alkaline phosphatase family protein [Bifidobacterium sp. ESL0745]